MSAPPDDPKLSFARGLFFGDIAEEAVFPFPDGLDDDARETLSLLMDPLDKFLEQRVDSAKIDHDAALPPSLLKELKDMGLFGLQIPAEYDGLDLSNTGYARLFERVAQTDPSIAVTLGAHQSIGLKGLLLFGNDAQKARYLPRLASGDLVAAFCLTEPSSGSDAASLRARAILSADGQHYLLNGSKIWITNGGIADFFTVFCQTEVDVDGEKKDRISAFIVERSFGGIRNGKEERKLGIKGSSTTEIFLEDCRVPATNMLGAPGDGLKIALTILNNGRFGLAAGCVGGMKRLISLAASHANERRQFGRTLREFGLIKEKFARMNVALYAAESMTYMTCGLMDTAKVDCSIEAAIAKVFSSEAMWLVSNECLQVMGGLGYMKEYPFERFVRDARINMIFEGTNEILRLFIALSGIQQPGDHLRDLARAIQDPLQNYGMLLDELVDRVKTRVQGEQVDRAHPRLKRSVVHLEDKVVAFGHAVDGLLRHFGRDIIEQQLLLARVANMAIDLYGMVAVLSRASTALDSQTDHAEHQATLASIFCEEADRRLRRNLRALEMGPKNGDRELTKVADDLLSAGHYLPSHPTKVE